MKCNNCGKDIPKELTNCPYCNNNEISLTTFIKTLNQEKLIYIPVVVSYYLITILQ